MLRLRKAVYGLIHAPLRWHQRLSRAFRQAGFVSLQMDPCVWILPAPSSGETCSSCRCANQVENSRHLLLKLRWTAGNDRGMSKVCWESMLMICLVGEISLFRKLCNGFGLNLNLELGSKVDFDFVAESCVNSTIENPSRSPCQSLFNSWSPFLFPNM